MGDETRPALDLTVPLEEITRYFNNLCETNGFHEGTVEDKLGRLEQVDIQLLTERLLTHFKHVIQSLGTTEAPFRVKDSATSDIYGLLTAATSLSFERERFVQLLTASLQPGGGNSDTIWTHLGNCIHWGSRTPPQVPRAQPAEQTPSRNSMSGLVNTSEYRRYTNTGLRQEMAGRLYVNVPGLLDTYFGDMVHLDDMAENFLSSSQLFSQDDRRWLHWPSQPTEDTVLKWLQDVFAGIQEFASARRKIRPLEISTKSKKYREGRGPDRALDVGLVSPTGDRDGAGLEESVRWSDVEVIGELKGNKNEDCFTRAWTDVLQYATQVLANQVNRCFLPGFTICGARMRMWHIDRAGVMASGLVDVNSDARTFVLIMLGFLRLGDDGMGFDQSITLSEGKPAYIRITNGACEERLVIDELMTRRRGITGRGTTCWKVHREEKPGEYLVVKDSWQPAGREEEGTMLHEAQNKGVVCVARYYSHETVKVGDGCGDIMRDIRKGVDCRKGKPGWQKSMDNGSNRPSRGADELYSTSSHGDAKRRRSTADGDSSHSFKRPKATSSANVVSEAVENRFHRRVVVRDYGMPISKARTLAEVLRTLRDCIDGHKSLLEDAGFLHRDISIHNVMMREEGAMESVKRGFLIDLDLAVREDRLLASGVKFRTGTRAFMAIGVLQGEAHNYVHDIESFFWVLFWYCVHYPEPGEPVVNRAYEDWNYKSDDSLSQTKSGIIARREFKRAVERSFTPRCRRILPCVIQLWEVIFPDGSHRSTGFQCLYEKVKTILQAQVDALEREDLDRGVVG